MTDPVYAFVLDWPEDNVVTLGAPTVGPKTKISLLGYPGKINVKLNFNFIKVDYK